MLSRYGGSQYRVSDYINGYLRRIDPHANLTAHFCDGWPGSFGCELVRRDLQTPAMRMRALGEIVHAHVRHYPECVVSPSTIVVHLRLGDVFEWTSRYDCADRTMRLESCAYAAPAYCVARLVHDVPGAIMIVGDPWYRAKELRHHGRKSLAYVSETRRHLERLRRDVKLALGRSPDCDMVAFRTASVLVAHHHGGFAAIAREMARAHNATVIMQ